MKEVLSTVCGSVVSLIVSKVSDLIWVVEHPHQFDNRWKYDYVGCHIRPFFFSETFCCDCYMAMLQYTFILQLDCHTVPSGLCKIESDHTQCCPWFSAWKIWSLNDAFNFFQDTMMVARSSHPVALTLIYKISSCGASCKTVLLQETWFIKGTWSDDHPVVLHCFQINCAIRWSFMYRFVVRRLWGRVTLCTKLPRLCALVCVRYATFL
jgi:hypothetical protein